jgi:hypothetical protein
VEFDGVSEYMGTSFTPDFIHTGATLSYWVKMDNFTGFQVMGCFTSGEPTYFYLGFNGTNINWGVHDAYKNSVDVSSYVSVGSWHHLCMTVTGGAVTAYIDGVSRDTGTYTPAEANNPSLPFSVGALAGPSIIDPMEANIDEVSIFSTALSSGDIGSIYGGGTPSDLSPFSPVSWWRMGDSGTATSAVADVAGDNNGSLFNGPSYELDVPSA